MKPPRWRAWRTYQVLASPLLVFSLVVGLAALVLGWLAVLAGWPVFTNSVLGWGLILLSATSALSQGFVFATTYLPSYGFKPASQEVLDRADFSSLRVLGSSLLRPDQADIKTIYSDLSRTEAAKSFFRRLEIDPAEIMPILESDSTLRVEDIFRNARELADRTQERLLRIEHWLAAFLIQPTFATLLRQHDLREQDIRFVLQWLVTLRTLRRRQREWWQEDQLLDFSGIGLSWVAGFTPWLDRFSRLPVGNLWDQFIIGRERYTDQVVTTLARQRQTNVLLVGQPGTGRLGVVKELARRIKAHQAHPEINGQRLVYLELGEVLAQGKNSASQIAFVTQILKEMEKAGNIIAVINGLGSVLGQGGEDRVNLTEVLLPFFASLTVRVVVILSTEEYYLRIKDNEELAHFFEVVQVDSTDAITAQAVLASALPLIEKQTGIYIPYRSLRALAVETRGLLQHIPYPERAFDVLEEALVKVQAKRQRRLTEEMVTKIISEKTGVPLGQLGEQERTNLLELEEVMHRYLVNQEHAVQAVTRAMIRARAGVRDTAKPIGSFLFLGPTGVGKTETAKTLARVYFGDPTAMIRLDMSEFQGEDGLGRLIGSRHEATGRLTSAIAAKPFTVVLLDEFEKAHPVIHQLFLQVFDEGHLTDARGNKVSFEHSLIIATSNAGAEFIRQAVEKGKLPSNFDENLRDFVLEQGIYRPELMNRFDGVITFVPLSPDHIRAIAKLMLTNLNERLDSEHGVRVALTEGLLDFLVEKGYNPEFGARPMQRAIQDTVEFAVAKALVADSLQPGQRVVINPQDLSLQILR